MRQALWAVWVTAAIAGSLAISGSATAKADPDVDFYAVTRDLKAYGITAKDDYSPDVVLVDICDWLQSEPGFFGTSTYGGPSDSFVVNSIQTRIANPTPAKVHALGAVATSRYSFCPAQRGSLDGVLQSSSEPLLKAAASAGTWQRVANNGNTSDWRLVIS